MRVLAGGPTREDESEVFRLHLEGLQAQRGELEVVIRHEVVPRVSDEMSEFVGGSGRWPRQAVENVARSRQRFMEESDKMSEFDGLLMVDSDVILGPGVLDRMWRVDADVVYGVFWTVWPGWTEAMPQVWDIHPYAHTEGLLNELVGWDKEVEVFGGGACTLFRGRAFESRYWPLLQGLQSPGWYGEDRSYCVGLEARGIKQVAVTGLPICHLYRPEQQTPESILEARRVLGL